MYYARGTLLPHPPTQKATGLRSVYECKEGTLRGSQGA
jgi:hypothetical protein